MLKVLADGKDITLYVVKVIWSGSMDEVARKIEFELAYNTASKDSAFNTVQALALGTTVELVVEDTTIFYGRVFVRRRNTDSFVMSYVAYDNLLYLAKSKVHMVFNSTSVSEGITKICSDLGLKISNIPLLETKVSFIADDKSASEVITMLLTRVKADTKKEYVLQSTKEGITLIEQGTLIDDCVAKTMYNVMSSSHSESIEEVINKVVAIDEVGKVVATYENNKLIEQIGILQDVYKMQPNKPNESVDNVAMAKAKLTQLKEESSIRLLGDIRVITGKAIKVQEEQLQGKFLVMSDTHAFEKNYHTMELGLQFMREVGRERR